MNVDIKISRKYLINTKDFNNVESNVELNLKDIDIKTYSKKFGMLSKLLDYTQAVELHSVLSEGITISGKDHHYFDVLDKNLDQIKNNIKLISKALSEQDS